MALKNTHNFKLWKQHNNNEQQKVKHKKNLVGVTAENSDFPIYLAANLNCLHFIVLKFTLNIFVLSKIFLVFFTH